MRGKRVWQPSVRGRSRHADRSACLPVVGGLEGAPTALAVPVLLALWPEQIFQSQQTRFYIIAGFFSFSSLLVGGLAVRRRSIAAAAAACCLVLVAIFCHVVAAVLWGIIFAGVLAAASAERRPVSPRLIFVFLAGGACIAGVLAAYVWPLMRGLEPRAKWGYSTAHSILGSVNMVGWPVFLLAVLGGLRALAWTARRGLVLGGLCRWVGERLFSRCRAWFPTPRLTRFPSP